MPIPRFTEPMSYVTWPLSMYEAVGQQHPFQQPQVIMPSGGGYGGGGWDMFGNMFGDMMQQMQQRQQLQKQTQMEARAVQSMVPTLKEMGYNIDQINALFPVAGQDLVKTGMEQTQFNAHQHSELQRQLDQSRMLHEQEVQMNNLTPDQLNAVDAFKDGKLNWSQLTQVIPYDKLGKAMELNEKGFNLRKNAALMPLEVDEKTLKVQHDMLVNSDLPEKQKAELNHIYQQITESKDRISNSKSRLDMEAARDKLNQDKFKWQQHIQQSNLELRAKGTGTHLSQGLTQDNFKTFNNIKALDDGSLQSVQNMFQAARKAGINVPAPTPLTTSKKYLQIIKAQLQNKSIDSLQSQKTSVDTEIGREKGIVNQLSSMEKKLQDPKTPQSEVDKLMKQFQQIKSQDQVTISGHKLTQAQYQRYLKLPSDKKQWFIQQLGR